MLPFDKTIHELQERGYTYLPTNDPGATTLVNLTDGKRRRVTLPNGVGDHLPDSVVRRALLDTGIDFNEFKTAVLGKAAG